MLHAFARMICQNVPSYLICVTITHSAGLTTINSTLSRLIFFSMLNRMLFQCPFIFAGDLFQDPCIVKSCPVEPPIGKVSPPYIELHFPLVLYFSFVFGWRKRATCKLTQAVQTCVIQGSPLLTMLSMINSYCLLACLSIPLHLTTWRAKTLVSFVFTAAVIVPGT